MKQIILAGVCICLSVAGSGKTPAAPSDKMLAFIFTRPVEITRDQISGLFGEPIKTQENKKRSVWLYNVDNGNLSIYWDKQAGKMEKVYYEAIATSQKKPEWDYKNERCLKLGEAHLSDVIKQLGIPGQMIIREKMQQLHYTYHYTILNIYFRKGTLVNYTLF